MMDTGAWLGLELSDKEEDQALQYQIRRTGVPLTEDGELLLYQLEYDPDSKDEDDYVEFPGHLIFQGREIFIDTMHGKLGLSGNQETTRHVIGGLKELARQQLRVINHRCPQARLEWQFSNMHAANVVRDAFRKDNINVVVVWAE